MDLNFTANLVIAGLLGCLVLRVECTHFRGGTINWKSEGGTKVRFYFRLGWTYGNGPGCTVQKIGQLVTNMPIDFWTCESGNCGKRYLHNVNYICTGANQADDWEQGRNDFTYTFPNTGPFTIGYTTGFWINLSNGQGGGDWNVATTVDLRTRSDTAAPNSSPESLSKPVYQAQFGCEIRLKLPVVDPDDDTIRCRWAKGNECMSVCNALPFARLDEETCTLVFNTTQENTYVQNGIYAVAVTIEDFPKIPITLDGSAKKTPGDALSSVPIQFLVATILRGPGSSCNEGPQFVPPTPNEKEVLTVEEGSTITVDVYADNGNNTLAKANSISCSGPVGMTQSKIIPDVNRANTFTTTLTWTATPSDAGNHIVCADVTNDMGECGLQRCFIFSVVEKGCKSNPCQNTAKCISNKGNYTCVCRPGFTDRNCEIDIDDCLSNPCSSGTICQDGINTYTCIKPSPRPTTVSTSTTTTTTAKTTSDATLARTTVTHLMSKATNYTGITGPLQYEDCNCHIRSAKARNWNGPSRTVKDVMYFFLGIPLGLCFSIFSSFFFLITGNKYENGVIRRRIKDKIKIRNGEELRM